MELIQITESSDDVGKSHLYSYIASVNSTNLPSSTPILGAEGFGICNRKPDLVLISRTPSTSYLPHSLLTESSVQVFGNMP